MTVSKLFKICPMCQMEWATRDEFLDDNSLEIIGYTAHFKNLEGGLFYFTHRKQGCYTTLVVRAEYFISLYTGKKYSERRTGEKDCPGYCLDKNQLSRCDAFCECAFNREVIQIITSRQNKS